MAVTKATTAISVVTIVSTASEAFILPPPPKAAVTQATLAPIPIGTDTSRGNLGSGDDNTDTSGGSDSSGDDSSTDGSNSSSEASSNPNVLPMKSIIAISVGSGVAVLMLVAAVIYVRWRRRTREHQGFTAMNDTESGRESTVKSYPEHNWAPDTYRNEKPTDTPAQPAFPDGLERSGNSVPANTFEGTGTPQAFDFESSGSVLQASKYESCGSLQVTNFASLPVDDTMPSDNLDSVSATMRSNNLARYASVRSNPFDLERSVTNESTLTRSQSVAPSEMTSYSVHLSHYESAVDAWRNADPGDVPPMPKRTLTQDSLPPMPDMRPISWVYTDDTMHSQGESAVPAPASQVLRPGQQPPTPRTQGQQGHQAGHSTASDYLYQPSSF